MRLPAKARFEVFVRSWVPGFSLRTSNSAPFSSIFLHIGEKIKRTLAWPGHNHHRERPLPFRGHPHETPICHLLAMAEVKEWNQFQCIWVPRDPTFWNLGQCRVVVGVRRGSQTIVQQDGFRSQLIPCSDALRSKLKELGRNGCLPVCSKFCRASQIESFNLTGRERA